MRYKEARYVEYDGSLYRLDLNQPLLKCLTEEDGDYILR